MFSITWKHYNYLANFNFIFQVAQNLNPILSQL